MSLDEIRVLLVDDEKEFLETLVKRLVKRKLKASGVGGGEQALLALREKPVDVVVLDVKMAGMNGIETLREIRRHYPLVEVIMLTGHANLEAAIEGMEIGAFDYLTKPVEIDELLYKVQDAYQKKALQEQKIALMQAAAGPLPKPGASDLLEG
ncbi:MAG: response regulator [Syntrophobacteraceae bacterium]|nr:response regulator [Syntrophobacteraceae bacterium]